MNKRHILLIFIFLLGFLVRSAYVDKIPPGLNRDEASIGYTAYSLVASGKDEYGVSWPVSFKSFGDWKLPFYIYLDIPFIKILGLTDIAVRLPSVLFSSLTVVVVYFLVQEIFRRVSQSGSHWWIAKMPLTSAFLFAISPWSIHLSRNASESTVGIFFTALGVLLYLRSSKHKLFRLIGTVFLILPLYTYHGNHIFSLLLYVGLTIFVCKQYKSEKSFWLSIAIFIFFSLFIYSKTLFVADKTKISGLFALGDPALVYEKITIDRLEHSYLPKIFASFLHNKIVFSATSVLQNYIKSFSPEFLFITGGGNTQHNIPDFGNLYLWMAPFLFLGVSYLLILKGNIKYLLWWWLLMAPVAASITKDAPHTNRMATILPIIDILIALGFLKSINILLERKKLFSMFGASVLVVLFTANFAIWNDRYFIHFPFKRAAIWGEGYTKLISYLSSNKNLGVRELVMSRPEYSPYIYFLFYNRIDPGYFQNSVVRYPETAEGFQHVAKLGNLSFRQIDWSDDLSVPDRLYIEWTDHLPPSATDSSTLVTKDLLKTLQLNNKDVSDLQIGDQVISTKVAEIKLQNNSSMFTLIKTVKR